MSRLETGVLRDYRRGAREQAWTDLVQSARCLRRSPDRWGDAVAVASETMRRARHNVELLVDSLPRLGYQFSDPKSAHIPPEPDITRRLDELEAATGPLPLSLRCWFEQVGSVDLTGEHPEWDYDYPDPLVVDAPVEEVLAGLAEWREQQELVAEDRGLAFRIPIAPDHLHKAGGNGGAPYELEVPDAGVDGLLFGEFHQTTFVSYLRSAFRLAGFPGWERRDPLTGPPGPPPVMLRELAATLLPL